MSITLQVIKFMFIIQQVTYPRFGTYYNFEDTCATCRGATLLSYIKIWFVQTYYLILSYNFDQSTYEGRFTIKTPLVKKNMQKNFQFWRSLTTPGRPLESLWPNGQRLYSTPPFQRYTSCEVLLSWASIYHYHFND